MNLSTQEFTVYDWTFMIRQLYCLFLMEKSVTLAVIGDSNIMQDLRTDIKGKNNKGYGSKQKMG